MNGADEPRVEIHDALHHDAATAMGPTDALEEGAPRADAAQILPDLGDYPLVVTRDLEQARQWLRARRRGAERVGLLASSNALLLKPHGIYVRAGIEPAKWFLSPSDDVRSSDALEDAATEFEVQGLELDWACVCWDANFLRAD